MTPAESRQLASLIQNFSPAEKTDFYYFTIVEKQDPVAYVARMRKQSLVDLIKASFGGDRSAAGRYAANMRWRGQGKVAGFVGKGVYKLGADGSIHPKALVEEMLAEHPDGGPYHNATEDSKWKALVCKNIATNMSDVSTTEIINVLDDINTSKSGLFNHIPTDLVRILREVDDGTVKKFILSRTGTVVDASKEDYLKRETERLAAKGEQPNDRLYSNYWDGLAVDGQVFDSATPEGQIALKQAAIKPLVDSWAATANDANELSLAVQDVAQKVFGVDALSWESNIESDTAGESGKATYSDKITYRPTTKITDERTKVLSSFLKAQYAATQQYFAAKGIKEVTLFRGMREKPLDPDSDSKDVNRNGQPVNTEILMRPLSSWATRMDIARDFTNERKNGVVVKARIKTKDILAIPYTGVGCWMEFEAVVIGRPVQGSYMASYEEQRTAANRKEADAFDYRQTVLQWAYADETGEAP